MGDDAEVQALSGARLELPSRALGLRAIEDTYRLAWARAGSKLVAMDELKVLLNGQILPEAQARIGISDAGFLHGVSVFTTALAHNGVVFRMDRHLARLFETVHMLGVRTDATPEDLAEATPSLLAVNSLTEARVRITLTPGSVYGGDPTTLITTSPLPEYSRDWYEKGIGVVVSSLRQGSAPPVYGCKTGCYLPRILARQEAAGKGVEEALWFTQDNRLAEACTCNVFLVRKGEVFTPPTTTPVLAGIVREAVLELCEQMDVPAFDDKPLTIRELLDAEEVFLTSSGSGVRPVVRIERHSVGSELPGALTRRIMQAYQELLDRECGLEDQDNQGGPS